MLMSYKGNLYIFSSVAAKAKCEELVRDKAKELVGPKSTIESFS